MSNRDGGRNQGTTTQDENYKMDLFLESRGLCRKVMPKDGACLFRAVAEKIYYTQNKHLLVRKHCIQHIKNNRDQYEHSMGRNFTDYIKRMSGETACGGQLEMHVLANLYKLNFEIYRSQDEPEAVTHVKNTDILISLIFADGEHYDLVHSKTEKESEAYAQSLLYGLLYKEVFQLDLLSHTREVSLQPFRERYFQKQDAYEMTHLEKCFSTQNYANIPLKHLKNCKNEQVVSDKLSVPHVHEYLEGEEVKVYSPNTDNKPFYLAKITRLNVTPGMHEVVANNSGTELVGIAHLRPVHIEKEEDASAIKPKEEVKKSRKNSQNDTKTNSPSYPHSKYHPNANPDTTINKTTLSAHQSDQRQNNSAYELNKISPTHISTERPTSAKSPPSTNPIPVQETPPLDKISDVPAVIQPSQANIVKQIKPVAKQTNTTTDHKSGNIPSAYSHSQTQHKYGPQAEHVKKTVQETQVTPHPTHQKPFAQVTENAHAQIKKLQGKLNSSPAYANPKFSIHPDATDLPEEKFILQYFYNLGVQYQLMRSYGSTWKDTLQNACPPRYYCPATTSTQQQSPSPVIPMLFQDRPGLYIGQEMMVPPYFYGDVPLMPFMQYMPSLPYGLQSEPFFVSNYGKHLKEEDQDLNKLGQIHGGDLHSNMQTNYITGGHVQQPLASIEQPELPLPSRTVPLIKNKLEEADSYIPIMNRTPNFDPQKSSSVEINNQPNIVQKPPDDPQTDPKSWPQPGGSDKSGGSFNEKTWTSEADNNAQRYSSALKRGAQNRPTANYTPDRTIYSSGNANQVGTKGAPPKRANNNTYNVN